MLITENLLLLVCLHLKYLQMLGNYPFNINSFQNKLHFTSNGSLKRETIKHVMLLLIFLVMVYQLLAYQDQFLKVIIFEGILYTAMFPFVVILVQVYFQRHRNVTELFNLIVKFEQNLFQGKIKFRTMHNISK